MQRRNDVNTADLEGIADELSDFLIDELERPADVRGLKHMQAIQALWEAIQRYDPDPEPKLSAYIGNAHLRVVADSLLFEVL